MPAQRPEIDGEPPPSLRGKPDFRRFQAGLLRTAGRRRRARGGLEQAPGAPAQVAEVDAAATRPAGRAGSRARRPRRPARRRRAASAPMSSRIVRSVREATIGSETPSIQTRVRRRRPARRRERLERVDLVGAGVLAEAEEHHLRLPVGHVAIMAASLSGAAGALLYSASVAGLAVVVFAFAFHTARGAHWDAEILTPPPGPAASRPSRKRAAGARSTRSRRLDRAARRRPRRGRAPPRPGAGERCRGGDHDRGRQC